MLDQMDRVAGPDANCSAKHANMERRKNGSKQCSDFVCIGLRTADLDGNAIVRDRRDQPSHDAFFFAAGFVRETSSPLRAPTVRTRVARSFVRNSVSNSFQAD